eukprot:TRINITY_DN5123_c1_g5_i1.p1 TRINITY_DN5123_c1_g5~~TRINITY_DN5123_c1_g5_i1.p1  ORF type:complete len:511 (+),score=126.43 TRINITY_DN5123_c1_g5_i1:60-1592(+)
MLKTALAAAVATLVSQTEAKKPNLVFFLIDDMGFNDFGWRSSDISTAWENANKLANEGIKIEQYYTQQLCTPARGAFLTGRHPVRLGLTHGVLQPFQDWGIPFNESLIGEKLQKVGYKTYGAGKWHVGYFSWNSIPTSRGFDHFYGYMNGGEDYFTHVIQGYVDMMNDTEPDATTKNIYSSTLFQSEVEMRLKQHKALYSDSPFFLYYPMQTVHEPLEALDRYTAMTPCSNSEKVPNADRKTFCGLARAADDAIGKTMDLLNTLYKDEDTIVFFAGDNGGLPTAAGNNYPLRGHKAELWEGGVRNNAFIWSNTLIPDAMKGKTWNGGLSHIMDIHATIRNLAGAKDKEGFPSDGYDLWSVITTNATSPRTEILHNIDPIAGCSSYRMDGWKLLSGCPADTWYPLPTSDQDYRNNASMAKGTDVGDVVFPESMRASASDVQLFYIAYDPSETDDVSAKYPEVVKQIQGKIADWASQARPLVPGWNDVDPAGRKQANTYGKLFPWNNDSLSL